MKILILGGSGFIGRLLTNHLIHGGQEVTIMTRGNASYKRPRPEVEILVADPSRRGQWQDTVAEFEAVINLAGASIFRRWSARARNRIMQSRLLSTRHLVEAFQPGHPAHLLNASAVGYYGSQRDREIDETSAPGTGFLAEVASRWESEALMARRTQTRVVLCRFGVVLGRGGGAFQQMLPAFRRHLGSRFGDGRQWFSWIHGEDAAEALAFLLRPENHRIEGPVNVTAPYPLTNSEFTRALNAVLQTRSWLPAVPGFLLRAALGEFADTLLQGQRVRPGKLIENGMEFHYPRIEDALADLVHSQD